MFDKIEIVTYEPFGYRKGKGDHRGWYFDIRETRMFGNQIEGVYQSKGRSLHSKDSKQVPVYLRVVDKYLREHGIYQRIEKLMKAKRRSHHEEAEAIDKIITQSTEYGKQQCEKGTWTFGTSTFTHNR